MPCMTQPRWLDAREERAWRAYRRMNRLLYSRLARDLGQQTRLSDPDYEVLSTLSETERRSWRASELAEHLQWSSSRLAHHVGRMEERGLVRRMTCDDDGRGAVVKMTAKGWRAIVGAAPAHVESVRQHFVDLLTPAQLDALGDIADTIVDHLARDGAEPG